MSLIIRSTADLLLHHHHHHNLTFFKRVVCTNATKNDSPFCDSRVSCFDNNTSTIVKRMVVTMTKTDQAAIEANIEKKKGNRRNRSSRRRRLLRWKSRNLEIGSGCVRCVWDVYYEKLEAYDKLYNNGDPKNSKSD